RRRIHSAGPRARTWRHRPCRPRPRTLASGTLPPHGEARHQGGGRRAGAASLMARWSLAGRLGAHHAIVAAVASTTTAVAVIWLRRPIAGALMGLLVAVPVALWLARRAARPWSRVLGAVRDGIVSLRDRDLSVSIASGAGGELDELVEAYNSL